MGELPKYRIVKGPWDKEAKKWAAEYGAVWEKHWEDGGVSLSVSFKEPPPVGEFLKMVEVKGKRPPKQDDLPLDDEPF